MQLEPEIEVGNGMEAAAWSRVALGRQFFEIPAVIPANIVASVEKIETARERDSRPPRGEFFTAPLVRQHEVKAARRPLGACQHGIDLPQFLALNTALGDLQGENFSLGVSLQQLFREVEFAKPEVGSSFPLVVRGEQKRARGLTFAEFAPELVREGPATQQESIERTPAF